MEFVDNKGGQNRQQLQLRPQASKPIHKKRKSVVNILEIESLNNNKSKEDVDDSKTEKEEKPIPNKRVRKAIQKE